MRKNPFYCVLLRLRDMTNSRLCTVSVVLYSSSCIKKKSFPLPRGVSPPRLCCTVVHVWVHIIQRTCSFCTCSPRHIHYYFCFLLSHVTASYAFNISRVMKCGAFILLSAFILWRLSSEAQWAYPSLAFIQTIYAVVALTPKRKGDKTSPLSRLKENCSFHRNRSERN